MLERARALVVPRRRRMIACLAAALLTLFLMSGLAPPYASQSVMILQEGYHSAMMPELGVGLFGGLEEKSNLRMLRQLAYTFETVTQIDSKVHLRAYFQKNGNLYERLLASRDDPDSLVDLMTHLVDIRVDDRAGLLVATARAQDPQMAREIGRALVDVSQRRLNELAQAAAVEQLAFLDKEARRLAGEASKAEQNLQAFQDKNGLTAAEIGVVQSQGGGTGIAPEQLVAWQQRLEELQVKRGALKQFLRDDAPEIQAIDAEIHSVQSQIQSRRDVLLSHPGKTNLGQVRFEFAHLLTDLELSRELYLGAVRSIAQARADASRLLKRVDLVQAPTLPVQRDRVFGPMGLLAALFVFVALWKIFDLVKRYVESHHD